MSSDGVLVVIALLAGIAVGLALGLMLSQTARQPAPRGMVFERDERGRIVGVHYV